MAGGSFRLLIFDDLDACAIRRRVVNVNGVAGGVKCVVFMMEFPAKV